MLVYITIALLTLEGQRRQEILEAKRVNCRSKGVRLPLFVPLGSIFNQCKEG